MSKYTVIIAEDEELPREALLALLRGRKDLEVVAAAEDGAQAEALVNEHRPDLLITDISMPHKTGVEVVESLSRMPYVIFTTSYDHFAVRAFELGAVDYIVKPVQKDRLHQALDRFAGFAARQTESSGDTRDAGISINESGSHFFLDLDSIVYIEAADRKTIFHTAERSYAATGLLKSFEEKLLDSRIMRVHKTFMINTRYISHIKYLEKTPHAFLKDSEESTIPVGRKYFAALKDRLGL